MKSFSLAIKLIVGVLLLAGVVTFVITNWAWVFSKRVKGEILNVERVTDPTMIMSSRTTEAQIHSYSILIQAEDGKLFTSSSEDRQWQVAKKGFCVEALLYRYPPWRLSLANTFFNARLIELSNCKGKGAPGSETPDASATPSSADERTDSSTNQPANQAN